MNHYKINPTPWNENLNIKSGMVVSFQNGLFLNIDGKSNGAQTPNLDSSYVYIGEVTKDGSFILKDGSNLNELDIESLKLKLRFLSKDEYTNEEGLILSEKIPPLSYQKKLSSFDESILIETDGNIEGNVSLFQEYFEQQECELNFIPIQIVGVYVNGIKLKPSLYIITLPKTITIVNFTSGDYIEIQYTKLKI